MEADPFPPHYVTDIERVFSVSIVLNSLVFKCFYRQTDIVLSIPLSLQKWHYQYQAGLGHETVSTRQKYHIIKTGGGCIIGQHMPALHPCVETCHTRMCLGRNSEIINVILPLDFTPLLLFSITSMRVSVWRMLILVILCLLVSWSSRIGRL